MIKGSISVVIPCFNEETTIFGNLIKINRYLESTFQSFEIIAVNDGSNDDTMGELLKVKELFPLKVISLQKNEGKGGAVKKGFLESKNDIVMFLDADLAIPIEELDKFVATTKNGFDIAIASRFVPGLKIKKRVVWYRKFMEHIFRLMRMAIINNYDIRDTQCGFKVFSRHAAMAIFPQLTISRFAFDSEIIFIARKMGLKIKELPITLQNPRESHVRLLRDPLNMTKDLLKIRFNQLKGKYNFKIN